MCWIFKKEIITSYHQLMWMCFCASFIAAFKCKDNFCLNGGTCKPGEENVKLPSCM